MKKEPLAPQEAIERISELATALDDPGAVGIGGDAGDLDPARREFDDEQDDIAR